MLPELVIILAIVAAVVIVAALILWRRRPRRLPLYVDLPGSAAWPQPFSQKQCTTTAFALQADWDTLRATVDRWLNVPVNRKYHYVPLCPAVFLTSLKVPHMTAQNPPESQWGTMQESDMSIVVPLVAMRSFIPSHLAVAHAYLAVDQAVTLYTGRESFGFRKVFGRVEESPLTRCAVAVSTTVLEKFGPDEQLQWAEVMRIHPPDNLPATPRSMFTDARHLFEAIASLLPFHAPFLEKAGARAAFDLLSAFAHPVVQIAYLKQLRDIEDPRNACYQAVIESPMNVTAFRGGGMLDSGFKVTLTNYASYPMISDLGLVPDFGSAAGGPVQTFTPMFGLWSDFDFDLDNGRVVAEQGANRGDGLL